MAEVDRTKALNKPSQSLKQCNYSGHFRITMTVDKEFEKKGLGLGNSEKVMYLLAL
jgi:hypothetical protein